MTAESTANTFIAEARNFSSASFDTANGLVSHAVTYAMTRMRLALLGDIHGNTWAIQSVLAPDSSRIPSAALTCDRSLKRTSSTGMGVSPVGANPAAR